MEFRKRPDQAGKRQREVTKAAAVAWHTLTQEEKDVSLPFTSCPPLSAINIVGALSSNTNPSPPSRPPPRETAEVSEHSGSSSLLYNSNSSRLGALSRSSTHLPLIL